MTPGAHQGATPTDVARYYDSNTRRFLRLGRGGNAHAIHRELWAPGVGTATEAVDHVNRLISDELAHLDAVDRPTILDFGCGVGGTLFHLGTRFPHARLEGVTLSRNQLEIAECLAARLGQAERCRFVHGDFQVVDLAEDADAIVAIEAFAHASDPDAFLDNAARHLRPGGRLIVVDDFLAIEEERLDGRQRRVMDDLRRGWRVPSVGTIGTLERAAERVGLRSERVLDLTGLTRPGSRLRDRVIGVLSPVMARLGLVGVPLCGNMIGGNALQIGLREGFVRYASLTFERTA